MLLVGHCTLTQSHFFSLNVAVNRHGFLPLQGLEVPLMVLHSKVFLLVLLQKYSPSLSKRKTLIRRVKKAVNKSFHGIKGKSKTPDDLGSAGGSEDDEDVSTDIRPTSAGDIEIGVGKCRDISLSEAMHLFTKIPFPEPKRVIHIKPRGINE
jgi:hypothetical protein